MKAGIDVTRATNKPPAQINGSAFGNRGLSLYDKNIPSGTPLMPPSIVTTLKTRILLQKKKSREDHQFKLYQIKNIPVTKPMTDNSADSTAISEGQSQPKADIE